MKNLKKHKRYEIEWKNEDKENQKQNTIGYYVGYIKTGPLFAQSYILKEDGDRTLDTIIDIPESSIIKIEEL